MKLDEDEIRRTLIRVEDAIDGPEAELQIGIDDGFAALYHFRQLIEAGYIKAIDISSADGEAYIVEDLTFAGHQLLKKMRNEKVWGRVKAKLAEMGGQAPLRIVERLLDEGWDRLLP